MAETVIDIRTMRRGTKWVSVLTIDAPNLKAPIDFCSDVDLKDELGLRAMLGIGTQTSAAASSASRRKGIEKVASDALAFAVRYPSYMGASLDWVKGALLAVGKSNDMLRSARGGDKSSRDKISEIYQKAKDGDAEAKRSARLLRESASLLDHGRATLRVKIAGGDSTGHDIGTRADLRMLPARAMMSIGGLQEMSSLRHAIPTSASGGHDDDHELYVHDPFQATPYQVGAASLGNNR